MGKADRTEVEVQDLGTQWVDEEISGAQMPDARLKARLGEGDLKSQVQQEVWRSHREFSS